MKFNFFLFLVLLKLSLNTASATIFEIDDKISADVMIRTFHAYAQWGNNEEINFQKPALRRALPVPDAIIGGLREVGIRPISKFHASREGEWADWSFSPLTAKTGGQWWQQALSSYSYFGNRVAEVWYGTSASNEGQAMSVNSSPDLIGIIGFNSKLKRIVVGFRGTQNLMEWVGNNFNFALRDPGVAGLALNGVPVHQGYSEISVQVIPQIRNSIQEFFSSLPPNESDLYQITFTGHSLGGAVATLTAVAMAEELNKTFPERLHLITFAAPPIGGPELKQTVKGMIKKRMLSFRNIARDIDPVPVGFGYATFTGLEHPVDLLVLESTEYEKRNCVDFDCQHDVRYYHRRVYQDIGLDYTVAFDK